VEKLATCKSGALTQDGGKYSSMRTTNSSTGTTTKPLTLKMVRTKKETQFKCGATMEAKPKSGTLFILIKQRDLKLRDLTKNSDSMSIDHSTSSPNFHSEELLSALEPTMFK
jgi:hypothetical protein